MNGTLIVEQLGTAYNRPKLQRSLGEKPDRVADLIVPKLGESTWLWLQALYELWKLPDSEKRNEPYPFLEGMTEWQKASLMRRIVAYHRKNYRINLAEGLFPFRPSGSLSKEDKENLSERLKQVCELLEEARERQEQVSIAEIVQPFMEKDDWFAYDLFVYIIKQPLTFFDMVSGPRAEFISGKHFREGLFPDELVEAINEIGDCFEFPVLGNVEGYQDVVSFLSKHSSFLARMSQSLIWQSTNQTAIAEIKSFQVWLAESTSELKRLFLIRNKGVRWFDCMSVADILAAWMGSDIVVPSLDDFGKLTITRDCLSQFDDFIISEFGKPAEELEHWHILRRPSLYLLVNLYLEKVIPENFEPVVNIDPTTKTGLSGIEKRSLRKLCQEMIESRNPYVFNRHNNGVRYKSFEFLEYWPEYKAMCFERVRRDDLAINQDLICIPEGMTLEDAVFEKYSPQGVSDEKLEQLVTELIPISPRLQDHVYEQGDILTEQFILKVLDYAESEGVNVADLRAGFVPSHVTAQIILNENELTPSAQLSSLLQGRGNNEEDVVNSSSCLNTLGVTNSGDEAPLSIRAKILDLLGLGVANGKTVNAITDELNSIEKHERYTPKTIRTELGHLKAIKRVENNNPEGRKGFRGVLWWRK